MSQVLLQAPVIEAPTFRGPQRTEFQSATIAASGTLQLTAGGPPLVYLTSAGLSAKLNLPAVNPTYTPSATAINPLLTPWPVRKGDRIVVKNAGANSVTVNQPDGTTAVSGGAVAAGAKVEFLCLDPSSAAAGWAVL